MPLPITLRQLEIFVAVAKTGQVSLAAETLCLSQSATSQALATLERQLDRQLFDRQGKRLKLSPRGQQLLATAEALLEQAGSLLAGEGGSVLAGQLRLACSTTIGNNLMPGLLASFWRQHPKAGVEMSIHNSRHIQQALLSFEADLGLIEGRCEESALASQIWRHDELVVVAAPSHPLAGEGVLSLAALADQHWILREPGSGTREVFEGALGARVPRLNVRLELSQHDAIKASVRAGVGLSCLSRLVVAEELARRELVALATPGLDLRRSLSLVWHPGRHQGALFHALREHLFQASR
ncbi:LysR substrate-binding domain-containing protein [Gallaecimonas sp. GXIMD4217]|uniref:LysR substrate-binding domain-containing protein n=1 Tax=Gallaecimonas sp. GXIMD4217 TaxID=3131927 RepID=UPI00311AE35E